MTKVEWSCKDLRRLDEPRVRVGDRLVVWAQLLCMIPQSPGKMAAETAEVGGGCGRRH